ncbi:hypothetical protein PHET_11613 [Paragonimus heterotremus]|uniref:Uncharacterized protein n=1 Tax=Paragonimus heterotremus TaxID=100268 RepID=A0A8J4WDK9_9TREM|nr:hypothetical protein PHET_11613 [Paragonimus heterotremus]
MLEQLGLYEDDNWKTRRRPFRLLPAMFRARSHSVGLSVTRNAQKRLSLPLGHCADDTCRLVRSFAKCEVSFSPDNHLSGANQLVSAAVRYSLCSLFFSTTVHRSTQAMLATFFITV